MFETVLLSNKNGQYMIILYSNIVDDASVSTSAFVTALVLSSSPAKKTTITRTRKEL